jgi:site-specific recombinase XerD
VKWDFGSNRAPKSQKQINADSDIEAIAGWLARIQTERTFDEYRRESMRLIYWCSNVAEKSISSLMMEDFLAYREWLRNPPAHEISKTPYPLSDVKWRPFRGKLSEPSVRLAFSVIHALFEYLVDAGYLQYNTVRIITKGWKTKRNRRKPLLDEQVYWLFKFIDEEMTGNKQARAKWVFSILLKAGLRISECVNTKTNDIFIDSGCYYLRVTGKGDKTRDVVFPESLVSDMEKYRNHYRLKKLPLPNDDTPLILRESGLKEALTRSGMHRYIKRILSQAEAWICESGEEISLTELHAHLFRHTAATDWLKNGANIVDVRDNLGHSTIATTNIYVNPDKKSRHAGISHATTTKAIKTL